MRPGPIAAAALLLLAPSAQAEDAKRRPDEIAAAKKAAVEGDELLRKADAKDLFINESQSGTGAILLRHKPSGYRCTLNPGGRSEIVVLPLEPRGADVGCRTSASLDTRTITFTRNDLAGGLSASAWLDGAVQAIRKAQPDAKPVVHQTAGQLFGKKWPAKVPQPEVAILVHGNTAERVDVGVIDGWAVKIRYTSTPEVAQQVLGVFWPVMIVDRLTDGAAAP